MLNTTEVNGVIKITNRYQISLSYPAKIEPRQLIFHKMSIKFVDFYKTMFCSMSQMN